MGYAAAPVQYAAAPVMYAAAPTQSVTYAAAPTQSVVMAAPVQYAAAPVTYAAAPQVMYESAPAEPTAAPVTYAAAPVTYAGAPQVMYEAAPQVMYEAAPQVTYAAPAQSVVMQAPAEPVSQQVTYAAPTGSVAYAQPQYQQFAAPAPAFNFQPAQSMVATPVAAEPIAVAATGGTVVIRTAKEDHQKHQRKEEQRLLRMMIECFVGPVNPKGIISYRVDGSRIFSFAVLL